MEGVHALALTYVSMQVVAFNQPATS
jgi:hypothetical protein